jgi:Type IV pilin-like G and H, putative
MRFKNLLSSRKSLYAILIFALAYCVTACGDAEKGRLSKVVSYIVIMTKTQSYQRTGSEGKFAGSFKDFDINIPEETDDYSYSIKVFGRDWVQNIATPKIDGLKSYVGIVHSYKVNTNQLETMAIICESIKPTKLILRNRIEPTASKNLLLCPDGYIEKHRIQG